MREIAGRRGLEISWTKTIDLHPCRCDPETVALLERAAAGQSLPFIRLHSGAGHDTQNMAGIAKAAMVFARCKDGRSHTPDEFVSIEDAAAATSVLAAALYELAY